jgi:hypothetical protein
LSFIGIMMLAGVLRGLMAEVSKGVRIALGFVDTFKPHNEVHPLNVISSVYLLPWPICI